MYLKEFREKLNLTQRELANKLELTQVTIARYETQKMSPTSIVIQKYIDVLQANPFFLFTGVEPYLLEEQQNINKEYKIEKKKLEIKEIEKEIDNLSKELSKWK